MEITKIQRSEVSHEILINETVHLSCHDSHPSPASPSLPVLCQFCVNQFSSKVEIYDSKNQSQAPLYEFPLRTSQIIPLMSPSSFFIVSNGQNFEVICPNSSIARKILRIIEVCQSRKMNLSSLLFLLISPWLRVSPVVIILMKQFKTPL